jgi:hypothetical protein
LDTLYPDEPPPLSPAVVPPDRLYDPTSPPPGGGQWASEREHAEHLAATTLPARTFTRFRGNPDFGKGVF